MSAGLRVWGRAMTGERWRRVAAAALGLVAVGITLDAAAAASRRRALPRSPGTTVSSQPRRAAKPDPYAGWVSIEPRRWPHIAWPPRPLAKATPAKPQTPAPVDPIAACVARLAEIGIDAVPAAMRTPAKNGLGCVIATPVRLTAVHVHAQQKPVRIDGQPEVDCAMAERFGDFVREIVAPLAVGHLGTQLTALSTGGFYCRPVDSLPGEKASPHATGIAVDVASFIFADGRRIDIGHPSWAEGDAFFKSVRTAACGYFTTVLGPGADPFHATHMHVDTKTHGSSDRYRICQ